MRCSRVLFNCEERVLHRSLLMKQPIDLSRIHIKSTDRLQLRRSIYSIRILADYAKQFSAAEFISSARVHLGLSAAEAEALSMTEFQTMLEMKFPNGKQGGGSVPSREEYKKFMDSVKGRNRD